MNSLAAIHITIAIAISVSSRFNFNLNQLYHKSHHEKRNIYYIYISLATSWPKILDSYTRVVISRADIAARASQSCPNVWTLLVRRYRYRSSCNVFPTIYNPDVG